MVERRIKLTGIDEGLNVRIHTTLAGADSPTKIQEALQSLFPDFCVDSLPPEPVFGTGMGITLANEGLSMSTFLNQLHEQRILDTALDAMSRNLTETSTSFAISRLAALGGKIAFPIPGEIPVGGVIFVELEGGGLEDWLQAATWHEGRSTVPRSVKDERAMDDDGEASTWI